MKKFKENWLNFILIGIIVVLLFACKNQLIWVNYYSKGIKHFKFIFPFVNNVIANDTFFTIAMGNDILQNGIQKMEILTWHNELNFSNPRWLFDVFIAILYNKVGFTGIYVYTIIMTIITLGVIFFVSYKLNKNWKISLAYTLLSWYLCRFCFYARAWQFSFIFIILEFYFIPKIINDGKIRYSVFTAILGILLANMHSSVFPIYLVMFLPYIAQEILYKLKIKLPKIEIEEVSNFRSLIITFGICFATGLLNPFGLLPYTYMVKNMSGFSSSFIGELSPATFYNNKPFFIILVVMLPFIFIGKHKIRIADVFYILGFTILTFAAYRSFYFFVFISGISISRIVNDFFKVNNWNVNKYIFAVLSGCSCILLLLVIASKSLMVMEYELIPQEDYPVKLAEYILENVDMDNMKLYNGFNFGSYLEFKGIKTFIDSRSEVFCEEFNPGCTILKDWYAISRENKDFTSIFEKYGITHVACQIRENINSNLYKDDNWNLIYTDEYWNLYEKVEQ